MKCEVCVCVYVFSETCRTAVPQFEEFRCCVSIVLVFAFLAEGVALLVHSSVHSSPFAVSQSGEMAAAAVKVRVVGGSRHRGLRP